MNIKLLKIASEFTLVLIALMATISSVKVVSLNSESLETSNTQVTNQFDRQYYQQLEFTRTLSDQENLNLDRTVALDQQSHTSVLPSKIIHNLIAQSEILDYRTKTDYSTILLVREKPKTMTEPSFILGLFTLVFSTGLWLRTKNQLNLQLQLKAVRDRDI